MGVWRERMRAHPESRLRARDRERGPRGRRVAAAHPRAALRAAVRARRAIARERERFTAYSDRTQGRNLLGDLVQEEVARASGWWRSTPRPWPSARSPSRVPVPPADRAAPAAPRGSRTTGRSARGVLHEVLRAPAARCSAALPPLNMWVRTAPRDAERFCWRIDVMPRLRPARRARAGRGRAPERAAARGRRRAPARGQRVASPRPCRPRAPDPPVRRRAAAGAAALRALGGGARRALRRAGRPRTRDSARSRWFPERSFGGRTYVPATAPTSEGRGVRLRVVHARARGRAGHGLRAGGRLHRRDRRGEPRLDARPLRPGDRPLARPPGPARRGHARLGRRARGQRRGGHRRARAHHHRPVRAAWRTASRSSRSTPTRATTSRCGSTARRARSSRASRCTRTTRSSESGIPAGPCGTTRRRATTGRSRTHPG